VQKSGVTGEKSGVTGEKGARLAHEYDRKIGQDGAGDRSRAPTLPQTHTSTGCCVDLQEGRRRRGVPGERCARLAHESETQGVDGKESKGTEGKRRRQQMRRHRKKNAAGEQKPTVLKINVEMKSKKNQADRPMMGNLTIGKGGKDARVELPPGLRSRQEAKRSPDLSTDINRVHEHPFDRRGSEGVRPREDSKEGVTLSKDVLGRVPKKKGSCSANKQTRVEEGKQEEKGIRQ